MLRRARVDRARALVTAAASDADNLFITLSARDMNPTIQIIARGEVPSTERKLRQAGADPAVAAIRMTLYRTGSESAIVEALEVERDRARFLAVLDRVPDVEPEPQDRL